MLRKNPIKIMADDLKLGDIVQDTISGYKETCTFQVIGFTDTQVLMQLVSGNSSFIYRNIKGVYPFNLSEQYPWYKIN